MVQISANNPHNKGSKKMKYSIIICEDESLQIQQLNIFIQEYIKNVDDGFKIELLAQSPDIVLDYLDEHKIINGIYLLDIDLKNTINGIRLAEEIRSLDIGSKIIFVTTHEEMAPLTLKSKVEALDFIEKNPSLDEFKLNIFNVLSLAKSRLNEASINEKKSGEIFSFYTNNQLFNIDSSDLFTVETSSTHHKLTVYSTDGISEFYGNLKDIEKKYPYLYRISRFCLININNIKQIDFNTRKLTFNMGLVRYFSLGKSKKLKQLLKINEN